MIFLTQLIYVNPGKEKQFEDFEAGVLPLLERYGGELKLRIRPNAASIVASSGAVRQLTASRAYSKPILIS